MGAVSYELKEGTALITMNRPEVLNALSKEMFKDLTEAVKRAATDRTAYFVVLKGAGRAFSAGLDIREVNELSSTTQAREFVYRRVKPFWKQYLACDKPIISVVEGPAYGAGAEIALAADIVVSSTRSSFAFSGGRVGALCCISAAFGHMTMNGRKVIEMNLTGAPLDAIEARASGLVSYVEEPENLENRVKTILTEIRQVSPISNASFKRIRRSNMTDRILEIAHKELLRAITSPDFRRGATAFLDKSHADYYR